MSKIIHKVKKSNLLFNSCLILFFVALAMISAWILFMHHTIFVTDDLHFHLRRVVELQQALSYSHILPDYGFNNFHGSAVMTLYPYLNLYPLAFLFLLLRSKITALYIFFYLNVLVSLLDCYYGSLKFSKSKLISGLFSIAYSLSAPLITYFFGNTDLGVLSSLAFLPLVIFGFIDILTNTSNNGSLKLALGFILLIYSHVLTSVLALMLLVFWSLFNVSLVNKYKKEIFKSFALVFLLTSIVWLPAGILVLNNFRLITFPAKFLAGDTYLHIFRLSLFNDPNFYWGIIPVFGIIASIILIIFKWNRKNVNDAINIQMFIISMIIIMVSRFLPLLANFGVLKILRIFQFVNRFYIFPQIFLCYLFAVGVVRVADFFKSHFSLNIYVLPIVAVVGIVVLQMILQGQLLGGNENDYYLNNNFLNDTSMNLNHKTKASLYKSDILNINAITKNHIWCPTPKVQINKSRMLGKFININTSESSPSDYYPKNSLSKLNYVNNNEATYGHNRTINVKHTGYNQFSFDSPKKINRLVLPLLHYNGEHLRVYVNHHLVHSHTNGNSLVTLDNVKKGRSVVSVKYVPNVWLIILECIILLALIIWAYLNFLKYKNFKHFYNKILDKKYFCIMSSLLITIIIMPLFVLFRMPITNINISIIDICIMGIPYCIMLDIILHFLRFDFVATILSKHIKNDKILRYFNIFIKNFNLKFKRLARIKSNILLFTLIFICSLIFEVFVISMTRMSHIIVELNRINKYIGRQYLSKINDSYSLYFMSWIILGIALLFILSIFYYKKIDYHFMKLYPLVIVSIVSIIGVMLTTLSTVQRGAYTQSISYNFSIMFIYLMTPVCIIFIDLIHIFKMIQNHELFLYHKNVNSLLNPKDIVKDEMYNSQYHYTNK